MTFALASLGLVHMPQAPIGKGVRTLTQRAPWAVAAGFGLLHGLGFAGALAEG